MIDLLCSGIANAKYKNLKHKNASVRSSERGWDDDDDDDDHPPKDEEDKKKAHLQNQLSSKPPPAPEMASSSFSLRVARCR
jgi:hypothetical protein